MSSNTSSALGYLEKAIKAVAPFGVKADSEAPIVAIINDLEIVDAPKALIIAKTLQQATVFNAVVRDQVSEMNTGARYQDIATNWNSIIEDSMTMMKQIEENKNGFREKVGRVIMKMRRGSIHSRFDKIKNLYLDVNADTKVQLDRERIILEAYMDFRLALKEGEIYAAQILKKQTEILEKSKTDLADKAALVVAAAEGEDKSKAQLVRDESQRLYDRENERYDLCKMVSENLTIAYNVGDTVLANLNSTRSIKQTVYNKAVSFFNTNEFTFTALDAALTSTAGLHEQTQALNALGDGMNRSLETLAELSPKVKMAALQAAHGPTIKAASVKKLIDSMITFQQESIVEVKNLRIAAEQNTKEISSIVDQGKDTLAKLALQA